jgi:diguanylate cyclase (GGDEF)-like protein
MGTQRRREQGRGPITSALAAAARLCLSMPAVVLLALLLSVMLPARPACAATPARAPSPLLRDYALDLWTSREGLPHNSIRDIAQTHDGYLWFATWEGVARYNGLDFTLFDRQSTPALADNGVGALYVDPHGALWLSDSRGNVSRYSPEGQLKVWPRPDKAPNVLIQGMAMDAQDRLWLLYDGSGLGYLTPEGDYVYEAPPAQSPLNDTYMRIAIDAHQRIWVGTYQGAVYRDPRGQVHNASRELGLPPGYAWPYLAADGTLWLVVEDRIYRYEGDSAVLVHRLDGAGRLTALLQDRHGDLWIGTENSGVLRAGRHGIERLTAAQSIPKGRVVSLHEDAEGSIWIGINGGLARLRETLFTSITAREGLHSDYVRAVIENTDGDLWIGTSVGLQRMDRQRDLHDVPLPTSTGKPPSVLSLALDREGGLWIGTYGDGLYRLDRNGALRRFRSAEGIPDGPLRGISLDEQDRAWVATQHGVRYVEDGRVRTPAAPGMPQGLLTAVQASHGEVWMGSLEGADVLRDGKLTHYRLDAIGGARTVFGFTRIGDALWIASDRGLYRLRKGGLARVGLEQGLPVDTVFQLVADRAGNQWITSNRGMLRVDPRQLERVADGRQARLEVTRYNEMDGMANAQGNGSSGPAVAVRRDGSLWFATAGGVATVDPSRLRWFQTRPAPPSVIEQVAVDSTPLAWRDTPGPLRIAGGHRLTVNYVGLSYLLSERTLYRTWLEGLDEGWVERGRLRSVEFFGLPPGDYTLHVSAAHPGGGWSAREARLRFSITPFWWQRHSVQAAIVVLAGLLLFVLYRYRIGRYARRSEHLEQVVATRTQDLRSQAEQLRQVDQEKSALLERLRQQSESFERQAREDALTGLPNRRAFEERLIVEMGRAQRNGRPLCLVALDVDHFKKVNDQHSHSVGDLVLKQVGRLLMEASRASDMAARTGGEEFCLLLTDTTQEQAVRACERLRRLFHGQQGWGGIAGLHITFSAGLVQLGVGDAHPSDLYQRADRLLYRAKRAGRDRTEFD